MFARLLEKVNPYMLYVKLFVLLLIGIFLYWAANEIITGREAKKDLKVAYQDLANETIAYNNDISTFTEQQRNDQVIGGKREDAIDDLRTQLIDYRNRHPDVRVHNCTAAASESKAVPDATSKPNAQGIDEQRAASEQPSGPNISAGLGEIAENADRCAIDKNALIEWIKEECEIAKKDGRGCTEPE